MNKFTKTKKAKKKGENQPTPTSNRSGLNQRMIQRFRRSRRKLNLVDKEGADGITK